MCLGAILWARCTRLCYGSTAADAAGAGFDDSRFYDEVRKPAGERELPSNNMLRDEAAESFRQWNAFEEKVKY